MDECQRLVAAGGDSPHPLIFRILIQLGLRPEELFALRRDDVIGDTLRIDEAIVEGASSTVKTEASAASVYIQPDLRAEIHGWLQQRMSDPRYWPFPSPKGRPWGLQNYLNRVLKPTAVRARVGLCVRRTRTGMAVETSDVNFQVLRRTSGTLFGANANDPRDTQAQLRHADPSVTLRHYQKFIPSSVRAAAEALETELITSKNTEPIEQVLNRCSSEDEWNVQQSQAQPSLKKCQRGFLRFYLLYRNPHQRKGQWPNLERIHCRRAGLFNE